MLGETVDNISSLLLIDPVILPNIITLVIVIIILAVSFKAQSWTILVSLYPITMGILTLLGIDSVFNLVSIVANFLTGA